MAPRTWWPRTRLGTRAALTAPGTRPSGAGGPLALRAARLGRDVYPFAGQPALAGHAPHELVGEAVGRPLGVRPQHVVPHLVVDGVDPSPFGVVLPAALPVLRVDQVDLAVLVGAARRLAPVEVLEPIDPGAGEAVEARQGPHRPAEGAGAVLPEEDREQPVDRAPLAKVRDDHAHGLYGSPGLLL